MHKPPPFFTLLLATVIFFTSIIVLVLPKLSRQPAPSPAWKTYTIHRSYNQTALNFQVSTPPDWAAQENPSDLTWSAPDSKTVLLKIYWGDPNLLVNRAWAPCNPRSCISVSSATSSQTTFTIWRYRPDDIRSKSHPATYLTATYEDHLGDVNLEFASFQLTPDDFVGILSTIKFLPPLNIGPEYAIKLVKQLPEIITYLKNTPESTVYTDEPRGHLIPVYAGHLVPTTTGGHQYRPDKTYFVNINTGQITKSP